MPPLLYTTLYHCPDTAAPDPEVAVDTVSDVVVGVSYPSTLFPKNNLFLAISNVLEVRGIESNCFIALTESTEDPTISL